MTRLFFIGLAILFGQMTSALANASCPEDPQRIVSLGGIVTEIIYKIGAENRLVGVDSTSQFPMHARDIPNVGYYRQVSAEGILSLGPDLVLADADAGPPDTLKQLQQAGVCVAVAPDGGTVSSIQDRIRMISATLGLSDAGDAIAADVASAFAKIDDVLSARKTEPTILFLLSVDGGTPMVAGMHTEADDIIALAGAQNAVTGFEGYKPLSPEVAASSAPDYILMMDHVVRQAGGAERILSLPPLAATPAGRNGRLISMDGLLLLGFGPRTPDAVIEISGILYPDLSFTPDF